MRALLASRQIRLLFLGNTVSVFGDSALSLALGIWVRLLTGSTALAGTCFLAMVVGTMLSPVSGLAVDRFRRKPLMIWTYLATAALLASLLAVHDRGQVWLIIAVTFLYGVSGTVTASAQQALVQRIVPEDLLSAANGLQQTLSQGTRLITPAAGAGLLAWLGGQAVAAVDAATFLVAVVCLLLIDVEEEKPARDAGESWAASASAGFRFLARTPVLRQVVVSSAVLILAVGFFETVDLQIVTAGLHHAATWISVLLTVQGVGSLVGGATAHAVARRVGDGLLVVAGMALMAGMALLFTIPADAPVLAGAALCGVSLPWLVVGVTTILQKQTPNENMGRVMGAAELALAAPQSIGIAVAAALIGDVPYRALCFLAAAIIIGATAYLATRAEQRGKPAELDEAEAPSTQTV
ncbi:MFS transporter [Catenulispora sp. NF23]|uniref:MFS transporter n=1 Tax=Catenulispora pinistramenti TaxID=2705254 RepID=A0ABS5KMC4_9ACTN|nr:MFS transporter [Catenulispora pinistramenti]MBS2532127.1 MFS transporter [Catenulispora pinistramenti]MBS2547169.1 MFS transporter [Catenulispora pinistramenti]